MLPYTTRVALALAALLQVPALLVAAQPAAAPAATPPPTPRRLVVCVVEGLPPMSNCSVGEEGPVFSGYDVEVLRQVTVRLNPPLVEGEDYELRCMAFDAAANSLLRRDGVCDMAVGAITTSTAREEAGVLFSRVPTYSPSLGIMVPASVAAPDGWFWIRPYDWSSWLAIILTLLAFPLIVFVVETVALKADAEENQSWRDVMYNLYVEVNWFDLDAPEVRATATRIVLFSYFFMSIFLVETYASNLAAHLTVQQLTSSVTSVSQLRGRAVGTLPVYAERLQRSGLSTTLYPPESVENITAAQGQWMDDLVSGKLAAFIFDEPLLRYADTLTGCEFRLLPETLDQFNYAFAFPNNTRLAFVDAVDDATLQLQEDGTLEQLRQLYITYPEGMCSAGGSDSPRISFVQFYGLWVVWGAALLVALLLAWAMYLRRWRWRRRAGGKRRQTEATSSMRSSGRLWSGSGKNADSMAAAGNAAAVAAAAAEDGAGGSLLQLLEAEAAAAAAQHARLAAALAAARRHQAQPEVEKGCLD